MNKRKIYAIIAIIIICAAIFIGNLYVPLGLIFWVLFVIPLFIAYYNLSEKMLLPMVILISALMIINMFLAPSLIPFYYAIFNRGTGICLFMILGFFMKNQKRSIAILNNFNKELEKSVVERTKELIKTEDALRESKERLDLALESGQTGAWELDMNNDTSIRNLRHDEIFGYKEPLEQWGAKIFMEHIVPEDREHVRMDFKKAEETGNFKTECQILWPDNSLHWIFANGRLNSDKDLKTKKLIGTVIDITERKKLEEKLQKYVEEVERSNKELEQFAYVASHDLQEPLRMVSSYTQLISDRYKDKLDKDANDFINYAVDGARRMQQLINDLLSFSRINNKGNPFKSVNMQNVLGQLINYMKATIQEKNALITNDDLPDIIGDESQILQLLQNLVVNALKFSVNNPRIHISAENMKDEWKFGVKDNGIGIEPQYRDKIFLIFQRLHTKTEYSGTGIGLAICKRIVERHSGKIWVESEIGNGSTFYFTIKKT